TGFGVEDYFIVTEPKALADVLAGNKVTDQFRPSLHKAIPRCSVLGRRLPDNRIVTRARYLSSSGNDKRDIGSCSIDGVVVEGEPARGVHQVRTFTSHIRQATRSERTALRRHQRSTPAEPEDDRLVCRHDLTKVNSHIRPDSANSD